LSKAALRRTMVGTPSLSADSSAPLPFNVKLRSYKTAIVYLGAGSAWRTTKEDLFIYMFIKK
jgi:hypothetical protein